MSNVTNLAFAAPRQEQIAELQSVVSSCIRETANEVGLKQVQAFFNGYKSSLEEQKMAA